jgi:hypothetical protein
MKRKGEDGIVMGRDVVRTTKKMNADYVCWFEKLKEQLEDIEDGSCVLLNIVKLD